MLPVSESAHVGEAARPWEPGSCRKEFGKFGKSHHLKCLTSDPSLTTTGRVDNGIPMAKAW